MTDESAKPLLASEMLSFLITWLTLERAVESRITSNSSSGEPEHLDDSDLTPSPFSTSERISIWPYMHFVIISATVQVLLSMLMFSIEHQHPTGSSSRPSETDSSGVEKISEDINASEENDIRHILRFLRASLTSSSDSDRLPRIMTNFPTLQLLEEKDTEVARLLSENDISSMTRLTRFVKAHLVPLIRRMAMFGIISGDLQPPRTEMETEGRVDPGEISDDHGHGSIHSLAAEFDLLSKFLDTPPLESFLFAGEVNQLWLTVENWWRHVCRPRQSSWPTTIPYIASPSPFRLIELPYLFQGTAFRCN